MSNGLFDVLSGLACVMGGLIVAVSGFFRVGMCGFRRGWEKVSKTATCLYVIAFQPSIDVGTLNSTALACASHPSLFAS